VPFAQHRFSRFAKDRENDGVAGGVAWEDPLGASWSSWSNAGEFGYIGFSSFNRYVFVWQGVIPFKSGSALGYKKLN
jgi:hypothetical protein